VLALEVALLKRFDAPKFVGEILLAGGYVAVMVSLLTSVGLNVTGLITTSAVATAVIGLSLQDMLSNLVSGVVLELEQAVKVGDWIRVENVSGAVSAVRTRHTVTHTADNDTVLLPNSSLIRLPVTIVSRKHRRMVPFHVAYGCNPQRIVEAVAHALAHSPISGVCKEPKPRCFILEFNPQHVSFGIFVWLNDPPKEFLTVSAVLMRVHFALARLGTPLLSISQTVELAHVEKTDHAGLPGARYASLLRAVPIFRTLSTEDVDRLGPVLRHAAFAPGEFIIHQGEDGSSMYVLIQGTVDVHLTGEGGMSEYVATLEAGQFFGEMSLLTGEKRTANVIAMSAVECLVVDKTGLTELLHRRPELAEDMSDVIAERQADLAVTRERLDAEQKRVVSARKRVDILHRIQRYFGIEEASAHIG